ncbi:unnamed protein product [Malus baccata var. baccata]
MVNPHDQLLPLRHRRIDTGLSLLERTPNSSLYAVVSCFLRLLLTRLREGGDRLRRRHRRLSPPRPHFGFGFQAHSTSVLFLRQLKNQQRNGLVTIGEDEQITPQQSAMCLKVFDGTSSSTTSPDCVGILRIFTNQFPEAKVVLNVFIKSEDGFGGRIFDVETAIRGPTLLVELSVSCSGNELQCS